MTRVDTLIHDLDLDAGANHAPEGGGEPELLVVAAAAVQADDEAGAANPFLELLDVVGQILNKRENKKKWRGVSKGANHQVKREKEEKKTAKHTGEPLSSQASMMMTMRAWGRPCS